MGAYIGARPLCLALLLGGCGGGDLPEAAGRWMALVSPGARVALGVRALLIAETAEAAPPVVAAPAWTDDRAALVGAYHGPGGLLVLTTQGTYTLTPQSRRLQRSGRYQVSATQVALRPTTGEPLILDRAGEQLIASSAEAGSYRPLGDPAASVDVAPAGDEPQGGRP